MGLEALSVSTAVSYLGRFSDHLALVGVAFLGYATLRVLKTLVCLGVRTLQRSFPVDVRKYGRWAVITGSTSGIGKSYAHQLAAKGMDVVLISRNPQSLAAVAQEIGQIYNVEVKIVVADFKRADIYEDIKHQLSDLDIGILVNNVGMVHLSCPEYFCDIEDFEQYNKDVVHTNVLSCVMMTSLVLPGMLERRRGTIINIGSGAGESPLPFFSVYSATKIFVRFFSEALIQEYESHGVQIQYVIPNMVESNLSLPYAQAIKMKTGLFFPTADTFVRKALLTIGRESVTSPHWPHALQQTVLQSIPRSTLRSVLLKQRDEMAKYRKKE